MTHTANTNKEREVRKWFVDNDLIDGVIYLPENLFYNTSAPGIIIFLNKNKERKDEIILLNASKTFVKGDPKNYIDEDGIDKIADTFLNRKEEEKFSKIIKKDDIIYSIIQKDLIELVKDDDISKSIFLFHSPPYKCNLDRAALDGKMFEHVRLDVHIGSIAIQRFIEKKQLLITLHGHIHESESITGSWKDKFKSTFAFSAAHNGKELSLIIFNPDFLENVYRELI